jgi:GntR family transcriptional regulator, transcriptional repressor for pyruvate dehydrogenase complex
MWATEVDFMNRFEPIKQVRVSEEVAKQLKHSILSGQLKPGDKLPPERELAEEFEVSRLAIREALRSLQVTGFVSTRQGSGGGVFITDLTFEQLSNTYLDLFVADKISIPELLELRLVVEPEVARSAARSVTAQSRALLRSALEAESLPVAGLLEDVDAKMAVHFVLAEMCGNRFFEGLVRSTMKLTRRVMEVVKPDPNVHPKGMHNAVVDAVLKGDQDGAFAAMRQHMLQFSENLAKVEKAFREKHFGG